VNALYPAIATLVRQIGLAPVQSVDGLRAKAAAALFECIPPGGHQRDFDFTDEGAFEPLFRACLSVTGLSASGAAIETRLQLDAGESSHERGQIPLYRLPPRSLSKAANLEKRHTRRTGGQSRGEVTAGGRH
jgi:hypothetical protein